MIALQLAYPALNLDLPWTSFGRLRPLHKRVAKHAIWLVIALGTGGAWVFYYADVPTLAVALVTGSAPTIAYATIAILTFTTFALGGLMREQVCTYLCPWPRIQGAMMDEESLTVTYRGDRGEPRAPYRKGETWEGRGDCVDCKACVVSCPMGIDIRDGQQFECITCSLCIDACDSVMHRLGRPRGLIDYDSLANAERRARGEPGAIRFLRPRTLLYLGLLLVVALVMLVALLTRAETDISVLRDRNPLYTELSDGSIRNGFTFKILNKVRARRGFAISVEGPEGLTLGLIGAADMTDEAPVVTVEPDSLRSVRLLVTVPRGALATDSHEIRFLLRDIETGEATTYDSIFQGPGR